MRKLDLPQPMLSQSETQRHKHSTDHRLTQTHMFIYVFIFVCIFVCI